MTPEEREKVNDLCKRIQEEKDPGTFNRLVRELDELLATKGRRIREAWKDDLS